MCQGWARLDETGEVMKFEWDSKKEQDNIIKHGISFTTAQRAFFDPEFMERYDKKNSTQAKERWQIMGLFEDVSFKGVLFVVYTERGDYTAHYLSAGSIPARTEDILWR
jgi:uncharacterized DUF497 family protein